MKFSKVSLLATASTVLAAPAVVTVTEHQHNQHTVVVQGYVYVQDGNTFTTFSTVDQGAVATAGAEEPAHVVSASAGSATLQATVAQANVIVSSVPSAPSATSTDSTTTLEAQTTSAAGTATPSATPSTTSTSSTTSTPSTTSEAATTTSEAATTTSEAATTTSEAAATTTTSSSSDLSDFASSILDEHNKKRALHKDTSALTWSETLADYAQKYADSYDCSGSLTHSGGPYGENLALGYSATGAVDAWYGEISSYDWSNPAYSSSTGHFTQVVWKSTSEVGCGIKSCDNSWGSYVICSYKSSGNFLGQFEENVESLK